MIDAATITAHENPEKKQWIDPQISREVEIENGPDPDGFPFEDTLYAVS